ncbi:MAG: hypothetical protein IPJ41_16495 [Phycisphaerales bacterium]|nr:hypothetical protein [Phycisphaerales bacterium]
MREHPSMKRTILSLVTLALAGAPALAAEASAEPSGSLLANLPKFLGRLHPVVVHFPIALLVAAAMFEVFAVVVRRQRTRPSAAGIACVLVGALGAGAAAWFGWINADLEPHGRGVAGLIEVHRWLGISTVVLAGIALVAAIIGATGRARGMTAVYRVALVLAAGVVGVAGHWGGSIVYGEGYITEALFPEPAPTSPDVTTQLADLQSAGKTLTVDFATQIAPIFADHCVKCHGPDKKKGNLRLDARQYVFDDRAADEQVIIPGDSFNSDLHFRISLPSDDEDAMPPEGKGDPLTADQVAMIATWIDEGAVWSDVPIIAPTLADAEATKGAEQAPPEPAFVFDDAAKARQESAFAKLRERGVVAMPVSASAPWAEVRFDLLGAQVTDDDLALLDGLEPTLVSLNLGGTAITDKGVAALARFTRLRRLHLDRTALTDAGLVAIERLQDLEYLNLYSTKVTDQGLVAAARLPKLEKLFVWKTGVSPQAAMLLAALKPGMTVDTGIAPPPASFEAPASAAAEPANPPAPEPAPEVSGGGGAEVKIDIALLPDCCKEALAAGHECDHPCCVAARAAGKICEKCSKH